MTSFTFRPAVRQALPLLIGLAGSSGSGKTYTAMTLAKGMAGGKKFAVIDTEAGRALHYADQFGFDHGDLKPPFRPSTYMDAIVAADKAGYPVIVVDSMSHEWAGDGGVLDMQEAELQRMGGGENVKMASWIKPKLEHKHMVSKLLQVRAHVILCFRAEPKVDMVRNPETKKMEVVDKKGPGGFSGWLPICEKNLPYELTASFLLMWEHPGYPVPIKLQQQHKAFFPLDTAIGEEAGRKLAEWARGGTATTPVDTETGEIVNATSAASQEPTEPPEWSAEEFNALLHERVLTMKDLVPAIGAVSRDNWRLAVDAWLRTNPGKGIRDLIATAGPPPDQPPTEQPEMALTK